MVAPPTIVCSKTLFHVKNEYVKSNEEHADVHRYIYSSPSSLAITFIGDKVVVLYVQEVTTFACCDSTRTKMMVRIEARRHSLFTRTCCLFKDTPRLTPIHEHNDYFRAMQREARYDGKRVRDIRIHVV